MFGLSLGNGGLDALGREAVPDRRQFLERGAVAVELADDVSRLIEAPWFRKRVAAGSLPETLWLPSPPPEWACMPNFLQEKAWPSSWMALMQMKLK